MEYNDKCQALIAGKDAEDAAAAREIYLQPYRCHVELRLSAFCIRNIAAAPRQHKDAGVEGRWGGGAVGAAFAMHVKDARYTQPTLSL